jgi:asparaginyl-tRNA synthetase
VTVGGWARTVRVQGGGKLAFVELNDGSCNASLQIVVDDTAAGFADLVANATAGTSFLVDGILVESPGIRGGGEGVHALTLRSERSER